MKNCNTCNTVKPLEDFYLYRQGKHRKTTCKDCEKKRARAWNLRNREIMNQRRKERYLKDGK